jgi:uncharacterized protein
MKVAYLHGLEATISESNPKIILMKNEFNEVYTPQINYMEDGIFDKLLNNIREFKCDLIIGSSMGGYFAYNIGSILKIPTLLFNPAVIDRSFEPNNVQCDGDVYTNNIVYLGDTDTVINGSKVRDYFLNYGKGHFTYHIYNGSHRVPIDVFTNAIHHIKTMLTAK